MSESGDATVAELTGLIERTRMSLTEGGRPDLAERCHVVIRPGGLVSMRFDELPPGGPDDPTVDKAISLDPKFERAT